MIIDKVRHFIAKEHLISSHQETILVALSGGADSVALLRILLKLGYSCIAAHCNFWLRAEESLRDEEFVTQLCQELKVPLYKTSFDTFSYAEQKSISIEMAARELRYNWFYELKETIHIDSIAIAHHIDDTIETLLLNLIRGTGIKGLTGIPPRNQDIIRPLLCLYREEIEEYLQSIGQAFVTDSTN
ncbi:MAG: tRNA lysidine(34) synthetase TilS, partial [Bacteroidales bacterium]|nr:tRNA lysidine(34) synthetase TilS [Bacteroidales bacterium]